MGPSGHRPYSGPKERGVAHPTLPTSVTAQVLSELLTTRHLKLINTSEIPHYFHILVSRPFSVSHDGASHSHRADCGLEQKSEEESASAAKLLMLCPQKNMLVSARVRSPHLSMHAHAYKQHTHAPPLLVCTQEHVDTPPDMPLLPHTQFIHSWTDQIVHMPTCSRISLCPHC
jgi:hypothetical protein